MKLYADATAKRVTQVLGDVAVLLLAGLLIRQALRLREQILGFRAAAEHVESSGRSVSRGAEAAGGVLTDLPVVGGALAAPFDVVAEAGRELSAAGAEAGASIDSIGLFLPLLLIGLLLGFVLFRYLPQRITWIREVDEIRRLRHSGHAERLLAHRALATRPLRELRSTVASPGEALATGDWGPLARAELRALGLRESTSIGETTA